MGSASTSVPLWWWTLLAGLIGLAVGSFWTVVVWRWPRGDPPSPRDAATGPFAAYRNWKQRNSGPAISCAANAETSEAEVTAGKNGAIVPERRNDVSE